MEPQPPQVTIVNPNAPGGSADVLSSGRDPWRPTARQVRITALVLALLGVVAGAGWYGVDTWKERQDEKRVLRELSLRVGLSHEPARDGPLTSSNLVGIALLNTGPDDVHVHEVRLEAPGFRATAVDLDLGSHATARIELGPPTCQLSLYTQRTVALVVSASTTRGSRVRRTVAFPVPEADELWATARRHCGYLAPEEAFGGIAQKGELRGRELRLTFLLENRGVVPLVVEGFSVARGTAVVAEGLPLTLPAGAQGPGGSPGSRSLAVEVSVTSCSALAAVMRATTAGEGLDGWGTIKARLHHQYGRGVRHIGLSVGTDPSTDYWVTLLRTCPQFRSFIDIFSFIEH